MMLAVFAAALPFLVRGGVNLFYDRRMYGPDETPPRPTAIVFGAAVYGDRLSSVLRDRMDTAIALYQSGRVAQILVSGGTDDAFYNEPDAMKAYAVAQGVPAAAIIPDYEGDRTYDTCYRARHLFGATEAVLVTQAFHLPRALLTCGALGMDVVGTMADRRPYRAAGWYEFRETAATLMAVWDVLRREPPTTWEATIAPS
jgi:SanA protein